MDPRSNLAEVNRAAGAGGVVGVAPPTHSYALSGKIMLSAIVILFSIVVFILFLHLYVRWNVLRRASRRTQRRRRLIFSGEGHQLPTAAANHALDPTVLKSLPMLLFTSSADEKEELVKECAVCLDDFEEGEKIRFLPRCGHRFHIDCIDMWFSSHSNCPLCRATVEVAVALPAADSSPSLGLSATEEEGVAGSLSSLGSTAGEMPIVVPAGRIEGFSGQEEQLGLWLGSPVLKWPSSRIVFLRWLLTRDNRPSRVGVEEMEPDLERGEVVAPPL